MPGHFRIAGGHQTCIAVRAQIFCGVKAEGGGDSQRSRFAVLPRPPDCLGRIFDQGKLVLVRETLKRVHVGALAVEVNWQQGANFVGSAGTQLSIDAGGIEIQGAGIDIGKHGARAGPHNGAGRGEETEGGGDDGVAGLNSGRGQREPQGIGSGSAADGGGGAGEGGDFALQRLHLLAQNEMLRITNPFDGGQDFFANRRVLPLQVEQRHGVQFLRGQGARFGGGFGHGSDDSSSWVSGRGRGFALRIRSEDAIKGRRLIRGLDSETDG